jgi:predicted DNA-binding transcriptional regulator AlpA
MPAEPSTIGAPTAEPLPEFIDLAGIVTRIVPLHGRTVQRLVQSGSFPRPALKVGRRIFWRTADVSGWCAERAGAADERTPTQVRP